MSDKSEWAAHPYTHAFLRKLLSDKAEIQANWAAGAYTGETAEATIQSNAKALGAINAIDDVIQWIQEEEEDSNAADADHGFSGTD